jgi:hypothetical protein
MGRKYLIKQIRTPNKFNETEDTKKLSASSINIEI